MNCKKCGRPIVETLTFCPYCGTKVGTADSSSTATVQQKVSKKRMLTTILLLLLVLGFVGGGLWAWKSGWFHSATPEPLPQNNVSQKPDTAKPDTAKPDTPKPDTQEEDTQKPTDDNNKDESYYTSAFEDNLVLYNYRDFPYHYGALQIGEKMAIGNTIFDSTTRVLTCFMLNDNEVKQTMPYGNGYVDDKLYFTARLKELVAPDGTDSGVVLCSVSPTDGIVQILFALPTARVFSSDNRLILELDNGAGIGIFDPKTDIAPTFYTMMYPYKSGQDMHSAPVLQGDMLYYWGSDGACSYNLSTSESEILFSPKEIWNEPFAGTNGVLVGNHYWAVGNGLVGMYDLEKKIPVIKFMYVNSDLTTLITKLIFYKDGYIYFESRDNHIFMRTKADGTGELEQWYDASAMPSPSWYEGKRIVFDDEKRLQYGPNGFSCIPGADSDNIIRPEYFCDFINKTEYPVQEQQIIPLATPEITAQLQVWYDNYKPDFLQMPDGTAIPLPQILPQ